MSVLGGKKCDCGLIRGYCNCFRLERKPKMSEQWEEIKIEDVQPGDVARCNGREFTVVSAFPPVPDHYPCVVLPNYGIVTLKWPHFDLFGFTFHRRVKREPRKWRGTVRELYGPKSPDVAMWGNDTLIEARELLDGEDGA